MDAPVESAWTSETRSGRDRKARSVPGPASAAIDRRHPRFTGLGIFLACLAMYHLNGKPLAEVDCVPAPYVAWSLVRHASFDVACYPECHAQLVQLPDGTKLSRYPPGSALAAVPLVAPLAVAVGQPLRSVNMLHLGKLVGAVYAAGAVVAFYALCLRLAPAAAGLATLLFALGTCLWSVASQALWMHGPATFWICVALFALLTPPQDRRLRGTFLAGLALGMAVLTRPSTSLFFLATAGALCWRREWGAAVRVTLAAALPVGFLVLYNVCYFGQPTAGGYGEEASQWITPLPTGLVGLLIAPSRGLLVYSPALVFVPWGIRALFKTGTLAADRQRDLILAWLAAAGATLVLYAKWHAWHGGWCFGPRFLCETMPILCLAFALAYARLEAPLWRRTACTLVALSVIVHFLGVFANDMSWKQRHDSGAAMFSWRDTQIEAHVHHLMRRLTGRAGPSGG